MAASMKNPGLVKELVSSNSQFAFDMFKQLLKSAGAEENVFFSPISISIAMAMTHLGAKENTAKELRNALKFSSMKDEDVHAGFKDLHLVMNDPQAAYKLHIANRLFTRQGYDFLPEFIQSTKEFYAAEAAAMDFVTKAEESREIINKWVEEKTAEKIKDLIPKGSLNQDTALILVNAIYFKGNWAQQFKPARTKAGQFFMDKSKNITSDVDFMHMKEDFKVVESQDLKCKMVELPYVNNDLSMLIVLPDDPNGLEALEATLTPNKLDDLQQKLFKDEVNLTLPKFKIEFSAGLNNVLKAMGVNDLFAQGQADLSGIDGGRELFVSAVVHKAFIEVNEEGTEAAAATAVMMNCMSMKYPVEFKVEHPFLFFIKDNRSNANLFMGHVMKP